MNRTLQRTAIAAAGFALAAGTASPALAARAPRVQIVGVEGVVSVLDDDSATLDVVRAAGRAARTFVGDDGEATFELAETTRVRGPRRLVRSAADLRLGDHVLVLATVGADGTATARSVTVRLLAFEGVAAANDGAVLDVTVDDASRPGDVWLEANGDPDPVSFALGDGVRYDDDVEPVAGDEVEVLARVSEDDPSLLEAIAVEVEED